MICILSNNQDPYFNIATEEFLLKNFTEDIFFLYINNPSVILGKHQNTLSEINIETIEENNIPVIRRMSGGGTVYHDPGNINFCFITNGIKGELVNFKKFTQPIVNALIELGVDASFGGRNDLLIKGKKISGNASHVFKSRVMHHGTLLFSSELSTLTKSLKNDPLKYKDKAVKSVRSEVTNITSHLNNKISVNDFTNYIFNYIKSNDPDNSHITLNNDNIRSINDMVTTKYNTWDWNFGYSPKYQFKKRIKLSNNSRWLISLNIEKGTINSCEIKATESEMEFANKVSNALIFSSHSKESINNSLLSLSDHFKNQKIDIQNFIANLF